MHAGIRVMSSYDYAISVLRKFGLRVDARRHKVYVKFYLRCPFFVDIKLKWTVAGRRYMCSYTYAISDLRRYKLKVDARRHKCYMKLYLRYLGFA
jgi:hypothetical protein